MHPTNVITPDEIFDPLTKFFSQVSLTQQVKKKKFQRVRSFFKRKTTKIGAIVTYWLAETAAMVGIVFTTSSLTVVAAYAALYLYASYVFLSAIATILMATP